MADIPKWRVQGDWFDTCNCSIPCPCTFAQPPTDWRLRGHPGVAHPQRELRRRAPGRAQRDGARHLQREHLGRADESVDGDVHRRTRRRAPARSAADDLRRTRRRLARDIREFHRRGARDGVRPHRLSRRRGPGIVAGRDSRQSEVERRSARRTDDAARQARAGAQRRWLRNRSRRRGDLRESRPQTRQTPSASSGIAPGGRASTSDSTGQAPTLHDRQAPEPALRRQTERSRGSCADVSWMTRRRRLRSHTRV